MDALLVSRAEAGQKLLNFLTRRVEAAHGDLHRWIRSGQVRVNGGRTKAFARVNEGDAVRVPPFAALRRVDDAPGISAADRSEKKTPQGTGPGGRFPVKDKKLPGLPIVFEDDELLVLDKPAGLPSQSGSGHSDSVASRLRAAYARAPFVPALVHRLDKDTSGLLVAGKTYAAVRRLSDALAGRRGEAPVKEYLAWVWGRWPHSAERELHDRLARDARRIRATAEQGRDALCLAAPLTIRETRDCGPVSLLVVRLITGRTHQIRVQLASRAFPVVGDPLYGDAERDARSGGTGLRLHACRVVLPAPWNLPLKAVPDWPAPWAVRDIPPYPSAQS
ncbi:MAG: RluA family pseudouridine synthase [Desulfovibrionaceae bacterium]|nr:RluA family pseudouridine synthase [Desulfovibrionaceae bacterium]